MIDPYLLNALEQSMELFESETPLWSTDCDVAREHLLRLQASLKPLQKDPIPLSQSDIVLVYLVEQSQKVAEQLQVFKSLRSNKVICRKRKEIAAAGTQLVAEVTAMLAMRVGEKVGDLTKSLYLVRSDEEMGPCQ